MQASVVVRSGDVLRPCACVCKSSRVCLPTVILVVLKSRARSVSTLAISVADTDRDTNTDRRAQSQFRQVWTDMHLSAPTRTCKINRASARYSASQRLHSKMARQSSVLEKIGDSEANKPYCTDCEFAHSYACPFCGAERHPKWSHCGPMHQICADCCNSLCGKCWAACTSKDVMSEWRHPASTCTAVRR